MHGYVGCFVCIAVGALGACHVCWPEHNEGVFLHRGQLGSAPSKGGGGHDVHVRVPLGSWVLVCVCVLLRG